jgi:TonB family protein
MSTRPRIALAAVALWFLQGCSSVPADQLVPGTSMITVGGASSKWEEIPMKTVELKSLVYMVTYVQWPDVTRSAGSHDIDWNWYKGGKLVNTCASRGLELKKSPYRLWCRVQAAGLGVGHIRVEMTIDGRNMATSEFDIVDVAVQAPQGSGSAGATPASATYAPASPGSDRSTSDLLGHCANAVAVAQNVGFPPAAASAGLSKGAVTMSMVLTTDGHIKDVAVVKSSNAAFNQAAIDTVLRLKCDPNGLKEDLKLRWEMVYNAQ